MRQQIDSSEQVKSHYYTAGDGCYVRLSPTAWKILSGREAGQSFEELARELTEEGGREVTPADVEAAWQYLRAKVDKIREKSSPVRAGFWMRLPLLSRPLVMRLTSVLRHAFHPALTAVLIPLTVVGGVLFLSNLGRPWPHIGIWDVVAAYALYLSSTLIHELGHSSACRHYGAEPSAIGFTLYVVYPALYSDVSDAWRLRRRERVVVDVAGMYFQLVVAALYVMAWLSTGQPSFRMAVYAIFAAGIINLNPVLRFDGYWLLCDALGVVNLGNQPVRMAKLLIMRVRRKPLPPSRWPSKVTLVLSVYSVVYFSFLLWFFWRLAPSLARGLGAYPGLVRESIEAFRGGAAHFNWRPLSSLLLSTLIIVVVSRVLWVLGLRSFFRAMAGRVVALLGKR